MRKLRELIPQKKKDSIKYVFFKCVGYTVVLVQLALYLIGHSFILFEIVSD